MSSDDLGAYDRYSEEQVSEDVQQPIPDSVQRRMPSVFGMLVRRLLLLAVAVGIVVAVCYFVYGPEWIRGIVQEYWPIVLAPIIGWILGSWASKILYHPTGKIVIALNPETHEVRVVFVPERMFRFFRQSGNNVTYHTPLFSDVYLAKSIDTEKGDIDYGWVHELNALVVFTREQSFARWNGLTEEVLMENNQLKDKPTAIALAYCRRFGKMILDDIGSAAGLFKPDYSKDEVAEGPEYQRKEESDNVKEE
ncbi:MAG: hypothetical protein WC153_04620 [Candidatus Methanomethylophilaceae archaeon]